MGKENREPLRCLRYVGRTYEQLVDKKARYKTQLVKIPTLEFYTFDNGTEEFPLEKELSLSDAFFSMPVGNSAELKVQQGVLSDYLERKGSEVVNMLVAKYSYEEDIQVKQQEAKRLGEQRGIEKGMQRGMLLSGQIFQTAKGNPNFTNIQIAEEVGCTVEDVENVRKMFDI